MQNPFEQFKIFKIKEFIHNISRNLEIQEHIKEKYDTLIQENVLNTYGFYGYAKFYTDYTENFFGRQFIITTKYFNDYVNDFGVRLAQRFINETDLDNEYNRYYVLNSFKVFLDFPNTIKPWLLSSTDIVTAFLIYDKDELYRIFDWYPYSDNALIATWEATWHVILYPAQKLLRQ